MAWLAGSSDDTRPASHGQLHGERTDATGGGMDQERVALGDAEYLEDVPGGAARARQAPALRTVPTRRDRSNDATGRQGCLYTLKGTMNTLVWIVQVVLALGFLMAGAMKLTQPRAKLAPQMGWVEDFTDTQLKGIGLVEVAAALGLVLPGATDIAPILTPLAAAGLVVVMISAAATHLRRHEPKLVWINASLLVLASTVAWARFGPYSF